MKKLTVLVFGRGYVGQHYLDHCLRKNEYFALATGADIAEPDEVCEAILRARPDVVINAAGKTHGNRLTNTRGCEESPVMEKETTRSNDVGPSVVADICAGKGIFLVHIGTGSLYCGDNGGAGFSEEDRPNALDSHYARTKFAGDQNVVASDAGVVLRIQMPLSNRRHERNLLTKLADARTVYDINNSVTVLEDLMSATDALIDERPRGIFNVVNPHPISHWDIVKSFRRRFPNHIGRHEVAGVEAAEAAGYHSCVLSISKLQSFGVQLLDSWQAVERQLRTYR